MGLSKYKLGELLEQCDERNTELQYSVNDVKGMSVQKNFIETKANMTGVSLTPYKLVKNNEFAYVTVTSRNSEKITLAYNNTPNTYIVSSSYIVFKIKQTAFMSSDYLFMYFNRPEFDRYARFASWGSARETFDWDEMCDVKIPIPPLATQQSIVNIYNAYMERKRINEQLKEQLKNICPILIKGSLEEAAQRKDA